jgi:glycosyltransferase involved in cell wall biosynthesis
MKIVFIGGRSIFDLGGIETYMRNIAMELVRMGHCPIVYCESDGNRKEWYNGYLVIHWKSLRNNYLCKPILSLKSTIHALIKNRDADVFHYNSWPPSLWSWMPRIFGKVTVMQGHGLEWKRTKYSKLQRNIVKIMELLAIRLNANSIMVSKEQADFYFTQYKKKCLTIPTAVYLPSKHEIQSKIFERFQLEKGKYFLFLGRIVPEKNPDILINAYVQTAIKNIKLVIAGSNNQMPQYVEKIYRLSCGNINIVFTGSVFGIDKEALLQNCFVFCIPSSVEGLSISLLEAMSYGKPVIATNIPSNIEGLSSNGLYVNKEDKDDLSEKMLYCIRNQVDMQKIGVANYQRVVKNFTWGNISEQYISYIKSLFTA